MSVECARQPFTKHIKQDNFPSQPPSRHLDKSPPTRPPPFQVSPPPLPTTPPKTQDRSTPIPYKEDDVAPHVKTVLSVPKDEVELHFPACLLVDADSEAERPTRIPSSYLDKPSANEVQHRGCNPSSTHSTRSRGFWAGEALL